MAQSTMAPIPTPELLPWLVPVWERLCLARRADRLPHALLISGPQGVGKRTLAELLARALLCVEPAEDGTHCGLCRECRLAAAGSHPDLVRVGPDPESKSGEIGIDAIRELTERAALTAGPAARRPILIDPADRMSSAAANALLKTLEEPAPAALLCLVAERPGRLPATVRSRCLQVKLGVPPEGVASAWLAARIPGARALEQLAVARGAPLRALEIDDATMKQRRSLLESLAGIARGELDPVGEAGTWSTLGTRLSLESLAGWLCDLARIGAAGEGARIDDPAARAVLAEIAPRIEPAAVHQLLRRVLEARALADSTLNPLLLLESLSIEWAELLAVPPSGGGLAEGRARVPAP